jgi:hypothetical protein
VHPIERLRYVARATDDSGPSLLVREAAGALASFSRDPAALVTACRRLVDRQPNAAAIWWLAARVLGATEPASEAWAAADEIESDLSAAHLVSLLPEEAMVLALGWPEVTAPALAKRGDLDVLIVDARGEGHGLVRRLDRMGTDATLVEERGVGAAAATVDVVLIEAVGLGSTGVTAVPGSLAAAAVGLQAGKEVWVVAGVGRVLPERLWQAYLTRIEDANDPWDADLDFVPSGLFTSVVGPTGACSFDAAWRRADCPPSPELFKVSVS